MYACACLLQRVSLVRRLYPPWSVLQPKGNSAGPDIMYRTQEALVCISSKWRVHSKLDRAAINKDVKYVEAMYDSMGTK